ncbi:secretin receptor-like isoform X3 [Mya arenaria]|uniref:secretin receptor-like isoform X3 n=1 Tax=Mya arenaria TaxID=6604 RepID=UPI0022E35A17|nr:secretin receptor-like isoform X3 [Mya arenaria]
MKTSQHSKMDEFCAGLVSETVNKKNKTQEGMNVVYLTKEEQREVLFRQYQHCACRMYREPYNLSERYCNRTWDNIMCWDDTPADTVTFQQCPEYINSFTTNNYASRTCLPNGTWASHPGVAGSDLTGWTNYTACQTNQTADGRLENDDSSDVPNIFMENFQQLQLMYNIGYAISLSSLVVAFTIMIFFRKLHCSRNSIHLNLFASFILRAAISLIKDNFMVKGLGFPGDVVYNDTGGLVVFTDGPHWECRLFFSVFQYAVACSYVWIFIEAIYLHMLIFVSVFTEKVKVRWFILFGWMFPVTFILAWCVSRYSLDNTFCWNMHSNKPGLVWIIKGPIMVTVVLNFISFINILRVLYTKLASNLCPDSNKHRHRRLARSTLFLVPTFGVYYIIFTIPIPTVNENVDFVMLFIEMFFNSFQGFFIALILCFINAEVRIQIRRQLVVWGVCRCWDRPFLSTKTDYVRSQCGNFRDPKDGDETTELKTRGSNVNPHSHVNTQHDVTTHPRSEIEPFIQINCDNTCV